MIKRMTMESFVEKFAKKDFVVYNPQDLKRGDPVWVYDQGYWEPAMFIGWDMQSIESSEKPPKYITIIAVPDDTTNGYNLHIYATWVKLKVTV